MEAIYKPGIVFRFRRPSSTLRRQPSRAMTEALRHIAESEEMRAFVADAHARRRDIVLEVFHSRDGHPLLIHIAAAPRRQAPHGRVEPSSGLRDAELAQDAPPLAAQGRCGAGPSAAAGGKPSEGQAALPGRMSMPEED